MAKRTKDHNAAQDVNENEPRLSQHPRARRQIRTAKAWSGLAAFLVVQVLALKAGLPMFEAGMRALAAGIGAYILGWVVAVVIWRQLAVAELEDLRRRLTAAAAAHAAQREGQSAT